MEVFKILARLPGPTVWVDPDPEDSQSSGFFVQTWTYEAISCKCKLYQIPPPANTPNCAWVFGDDYIAWINSGCGCPDLRNIIRRNPALFGIGADIHLGDNCLWGYPNTFHQVWRPDTQTTHNTKIPVAHDCRAQEAAIDFRTLVIQCLERFEGDPQWVIYSVFACPDMNGKPSSYGMIREIVRSNSELLFGDWPALTGYIKEIWYAWNGEWSGMCGIPLETLPGSMVVDGKTYELAIDRYTWNRVGGWKAPNRFTGGTCMVGSPFGPKCTTAQLAKEVCIVNASFVVCGFPTNAGLWKGGSSFGRIQQPCPRKPCYASDVLWPIYQWDYDYNPWAGQDDVYDNDCYVLDEYPSDLPLLPACPQPSEPKPCDDELVMGIFCQYGPGWYCILEEGADYGFDMCEYYDWDPESKLAYDRCVEEAATTCADLEIMRYRTRYVVSINRVEDICRYKPVNQACTLYTHVEREWAEAEGGYIHRYVVGVDPGDFSRDITFVGSFDDYPTEEDLAAAGICTKCDCQYWDGALTECVNPDTAEPCEELSPPYPSGSGSDAVAGNGQTSGSIVNVVEPQEDDIQ